MSADLFAEAVQSLKNGQRIRAKDLLTRLIKADASNPDYWLWMSAVVDTEKEQVYCLQNALKLDPNSIPARRGLVVLGALRPEAANLPPAHALEDLPIVLPELARGGQLAGMLARRRSLERLALLAASALTLIVFATACLAILRIGPFAVRPNTVVVTSTLPPSATPAATASLTAQPAGACQLPADPDPTTPLAAYLCLTQTPTPVPIATEPSVVEDYTSVKRAYEAGDWSRILERAQVVLSDTSLNTRPRVYFYVAEAYRHTGNLTQALSHYGTAISRDSGFAPAYWGRALAQIAQNRRADALADFGRAIAADPAFVPAYLDRAAYHALTGSLPAALADLEQVRRAAPGNALARAQLALAYLEAGQLVEARGAAAAALDLDPGLALGYFARGRLAYLEGDFASAQADLARSYRYVMALEHPLPTQWQARVLHAAALAEIAQGSAEAGLPLLSQAIELDPTFSAPLLARAELHLAAAEYDLARADYAALISRLERASPPSPDLPAAYVGLGQSYLGLDQPPEAVAAFRAAIRLAPASFAAHLGLGQAFLAAADPDDALASLSTAVALAADSAETAQALLSRAQAYAALGRSADEAADLLALRALADGSPALRATAAARLTAIGPLPTPTPDLTSLAATARAATATPTPSATVPTPTATVPPPTSTRTPTVPTPTRTSTPATYP